MVNVYNGIKNFFRPNKLGVIIVDMQPVYLKTVDNLEKLISNQLNFLKYATSKSLPIFVLECIPAKSKTIYDIKELLIRDSDNYQIIEKPGENGFFLTSLGEEIAKNKLNDLVFMGVNKSSCVASTIYGALIRHYFPLTSKDLIADNKEIKDYLKEVIVDETYTEKTFYKENYQELINSIETKEYLKDFRRKR